MGRLRVRARLGVIALAATLAAAPGAEGAELWSTTVLSRRGHLMEAAIDRQGDARAVFSNAIGSYDESSPPVEATRSPGGSWGSGVPFVVEPPPQHVGVIARNARDDVVVAGTRESPGGTVTNLGARIRGRWSAFALPVQEGNPSVGLNDGGSAIAAWTVSGAGAVRVATLDSGGGWRSTTIAGTTNPLLSTPSVAVNEAGDAVVVWNELSTGSGGGPVWAATRDAGGRWSAPRSFDGWGAGTAVVDPFGRAAVVWIARTPRDAAQNNRGTVMVAERAAGPASAWTRARPLAVVRSLSRVFLGVDGAGDLVAGWSRDDALFGARIAVRPHGGRWGPVRAIPGLEGLAALSLNALGQVAAGALPGEVARATLPGLRWSTAESPLSLDCCLHTLGLNSAGDVLLAENSPPVFATIAAAVREAPPRPDVRVLSARRSPRPRVAVTLSAPGRLLVSVVRRGAHRPSAAFFVTARRGRSLIPLSAVARSALRSAGTTVTVDTGGRDVARARRSTRVI